MQTRFPMRRAAAGERKGVERGKAAGGCGSESGGDVEREVDGSGGGAEGD